MPNGGVQSVSSNIDDQTMHELYLWYAVSSSHEANPLTPAGRSKTLSTLAAPILCVPTSVLVSDYIYSLPLQNQICPIQKTLVPTGLKGSPGGYGSLVAYCLLYWHEATIFFSLTADSECCRQFVRLCQ